MEFDRRPGRSVQEYDRYGPPRPSRGLVGVGNVAGAMRPDRYAGRPPPPVNMAGRGVPSRPAPRAPSPDDYGVYDDYFDPPPAPRQRGGAHGRQNDDIRPSGRRGGGRDEYGSADDAQGVDGKTGGAEAQAQTAAESAWSWNTLKKTVWGESSTEVPRAKSPALDEEPVVQANETQQETLWSKIAYVGVTLQKKINGDEGYASDASDYQGESHLIRIMKQYHVEKAQSKHELPKWLFTDEEIGAASAGMPVRATEDGRSGRRPDRWAEAEIDMYSHSQPRRGLDDIYDSVDGHASSPRTKQSFDSGYASGSSTGAPQSRQPKGDGDGPRRPVGRDRLGGASARQPNSRPIPHTAYSGPSSRSPPKPIPLERDGYGITAAPYSAASRPRAGRPDQQAFGGSNNRRPVAPALAERRPPPPHNDRYGQRVPRGFGPPPPSTGMMVRPTGRY